MKQTKLKQIRLACSGSGFLAPIHGGGLCAFLDSGIQIKETAGTSGGSIAAALLALGKSSKEIKEICFLPVPKGIMDYRIGATCRKAQNDGSLLQKWLNDSIGDFTFQDTKIPVTIMATDLTLGKSFVFSKEETPTVKLADACRASASVPFVWSPVKLPNGNLGVDGGLCNNIPVNQLTNDSIPRVGIEVVDGLPAGPTSTYIEYVKQIIKTALSSNEGNLEAWAVASGASILSVNALPYGALDSELSESAKADLFNRGYKAVTDFLATK